jgi:hypothetical protein
MSAAFDKIEATSRCISVPAAKKCSSPATSWSTRRIGVNEVKTLMVEHTWDAEAQENIEQGKAQATAMASDF